MKYTAALADLLIPRVCIVCGRKLLQNEKHICLFCSADIPLTRFWMQKHNRMADRFNELIQCSLEVFEPYVYCTALFFYDNEAEYRKILYELKYMGNIAAGQYFAKMLGQRMASAEIFKDVDLVIPVPLHWRRQWKRGYNQAEVIAAEVASCLGAGLRTDLLRRTKHTRTQTRLSVEEKSRNVSGAFSMNKEKAPQARHILITDDMFTTGATTAACYMALRTIYPAEVRISIATLGFLKGD